jgi:hypothetical protein
MRGAHYNMQRCEADSDALPITANHLDDNCEVVGPAAQVEQNVSHATTFATAKEKMLRINA